MRPRDTHNLRLRGVLEPQKGTVVLAPNAPTALRTRIIGLRQARIEARERFLAGRLTERAYTLALTKIAKRIDELVRGMAPDGILATEDATRLIGKLNRYADALLPWAQSVAGRMVADVARRDAAAWEVHGREIGRALRREINSAPTGLAMRQALAEQIEKITSLPREAAQRLFKLTTEAMPNGTRAAEIAKQILESGDVTASRAAMLARTGVSSTSTALVKARAEFIGSTHFVWRTSRDGAVRFSHRRMEGKVFAWNDPPEIDGFRGLPGEFANCRCFAEPVIPNIVSSSRAVSQITEKGKG